MRRPRPQKSWAVYGPTLRIETARPTELEAQSAAQIIGGTEWKAHGFQVLPVLIIPRHPEEAAHD